MPKLDTVQMKYDYMQIEFNQECKDVSKMIVSPWIQRLTINSFRYLKAFKIFVFDETHEYL